MRRNLAVGHFLNAPFRETCAKHLARIKETFFAWPGVLSCRPAPDFTPELRERMTGDLRWAREHGIELDALFNCNCYGDLAVSRELADFVARIMKEMDAEGLMPDTVTTTSPFIAAVLRRDFPKVRIRWSVNQRVHGSVGFEYVMDLFDSFYVSRERQRDLEYLKGASRWAKAHGKTIGMQANSGCLRQCPYQTFHDNLHGHDRIAQSKAGEDFGFNVFLCKQTLAKPEHFEDFLRATWLRPEDMPHYEPYLDIVKLATRRHPDPVKVVDAYATNSYHGNLADLMDPAHVFPKDFDNDAFGGSRVWSEVLGCQDANDCKHCGKCATLLKEVCR